jgi:hypothetical protein
LLGEAGEVDLVNVDFFLLDEIEEQIEWSFKDLKFDFIFSHRGPPPIWGRD